MTILIQCIYCICNLQFLFSSHHLSTKRLKWLAEPYCFGEAPFMPLGHKLSPCFFNNNYINLHLFSSTTNIPIFINLPYSSNIGPRIHHHKPSYNCSFKKIKAGTLLSLPIKFYRIIPRYHFC